MALELPVEEFMWGTPPVVKLAYKSEPLNRRDRHGVKSLETVKVVKDRLWGRLLVPGGHRRADL
ncbi:hypothetical protein E0L36_02225 [Streptomyces sp. AJS327]|nr:hypothetical protein [Streptomyces sp. AJS327]